MTRTSSGNATWTGLLALVLEKGEAGADVSLRRVGPHRSDCLCVLVRGAPLRTTTGAVTVLRGETSAAIFLSYFGLNRTPKQATNDGASIAGMERECCMLAAGRLVPCRESCANAFSPAGALQRDNRASAFP